MRWSLSAGRVAGIPVRIHLTFLLLVGLLAAFHWTAGGPAGVVVGLTLVAGLFGSVLLHELGHALAARQYGIARGFPSARARRWSSHSRAPR
jgi:Zn-dependent protease